MVRQVTPPRPLLSPQAPLPLPQPPANAAAPVTLQRRRWVSSPRRSTVRHRQSQYATTVYTWDHRKEVRSVAALSGVAGARSGGRGRRS